MSRATLLLLVGVFVGGAIPWLEAIVVIPAGILAGLHPVPAVLAGVTGNLLTVALAAWFGERLRRWWVGRRHARNGAGSDVATEPHVSRRSQRVERVARRWGLPALAVVGPIGLGTQISAAVAVGLGIDARRAFTWIGVGTVAWSIVAAVAAVAGLSFAGVAR